MAQVSALGGYVVDALLLLNFGERAAHLAARERRLAARRERAPRAERRLTEKKSDAAAEAELRAEAAPLLSSRHRSSASISSSLQLYTRL